MELEYKVLKEILAEQKKTNELLQQLIAKQQPMAVTNTQKAQRRVKA